MIYILDETYFYARAVTSLTRPPSSSYGFNFQDIISNNGHVYNSRNGTFVCPESGLYVFAFSVETQRRDFMVYIYRNGHKFNDIGVWPDSSSGSNKDTSSTLQVFPLTRGDRVYLYATDTDSIIEPKQSSFSGWRIGSMTSRSAFMAMAPLSTSSSPVYFSTEYLDTSDSFFIDRFQANKDGVYLFFWNMEAGDRLLKSWLQVNGETVGQTISDGRNLGYDSGSNLTILRLRKKDVVTVRQDSRAVGDQTMISGYFMFS
ncbi:uncharacterized protein LOC134281718 [Saccostrea cucullata]|uniref:uncharacterized protein LOC134281718 n=1 Tax=Saccostrea cuccullata TaxID=36930 RepID=UPI002ED2D9A8